MANVSKLKERARALEQREQWSEALEAYRQVVEEAAGDEVEIGLWNRIGDLHARLGQTERAVEAYDRAVDAYADAGLHNNAIALCRKILRVAPARAAVYLKLGQISAVQGFLADARQNFLEYATRMQRAGELDASFAALKEFADLSPDHTEVRRILADQLLSHGRAGEAVEQLLVLLAHFRRTGMEVEAAEVAEQVLSIDPHADLTVAEPPAEPRDEETAMGLDIQPLVEPEAESDGVEAGAGEVRALEGLETTQEFSTWSGEAEEEDDLPLLDTGLEIEPTSLVEPEVPAAPEDALPLLGDFQDAEEEAEEGEAEPLPFLDLDAGVEEAAPVGEELRERVAAAPEDTAALHRLVDLLEDRGLGGEAEEALTSAHRALGSRGLYREAIEAVRSLLVRRPADTALFQKQVEYAFRSGDTAAMVRAYLDLGRHLGASGEDAKSRAVYERVLDLDPGNEEARRILAPPAPSPSAHAPVPAAPDYVDLGSLILGDEPEERTTRFVVEEEEPTGDEDRDFADMLAVFRQKVTENIDAGDSSSHYDLGLAFMEMGLVDEAIAQFQVALRGGANPLATLELLGRCFVDKGQPAVAARVLERALRIPGAAEPELVGVAYQLGRCQEVLGNLDAAREMYERVLAFDIRFRDASERLEAIRSETGTGGF